MLIQFWQAYSKIENIFFIIQLYIDKNNFGITLPKYFSLFHSYFTSPIAFKLTKVLYTSISHKRASYSI